jgi:hypothetical protein
MNEWVGSHAEAQETESDLPDVTRMPIAELLKPGPTALDNSLRRLIEELETGQDVHAGFGNSVG